MKKLIFIIGVLISGHGFSADWIEISSSNDTKHYYDKASVKKIGKYQYEFWDKHITKLDSSIIREQVDCINETTTLLDIYTYKNDKLINSSINQQYKVSPPPDTAGYLAVQTACNQGLFNEISKLNLPVRENYKDDNSFQVDRFLASGFRGYNPNENMINDYFDLIKSINENSKNSEPYKSFMKFLDGIDNLKFKYAYLKNGS